MYLPAPRREFLQHLDTQGHEAVRKDWEYVVDNARTVAELENSSALSYFDSPMLLQQMTKSAASWASALDCDLHGLVCGRDGLVVAEIWQGAGVKIDSLGGAGGNLQYAAPDVAGHQLGGADDATEARSSRAACEFRALAQELLRRRSR